MNDMEKKDLARIEAARELIEIGQSYIVYPNLPASHPSRRKIHVRAIVDDFQVVSRTWGGPARRWFYNVDSLWSLGFLLENDSLKKA
jgi:hypothetical protein